MSTDRTQREADLITYYDNEVADRECRGIPGERVAARDEFVRLVRREGRASVLEVGTGPGRDLLTFRQAGLEVRGVDLAPASVARCRAQGLDVQTASVLDLPFLTGEFDAAYTASTLLHIADDDLDTALGELVRVVRPGSPVAIGVWGVPESREDDWGSERYGRHRYFALRSDADLRDALARHGSIEEFKTWRGADDLHYQWVILRTFGA